MLDAPTHYQSDLLGRGGGVISCIDVRIEKGNRMQAYRYQLLRVYTINSINKLCNVQTVVGTIKKHFLA